MILKKVILILAFALTTCMAQAQTPKSFKWVTWKNVTLARKAELKKIVAFKGLKVYDQIIETLEDCDVEVAVLDMDGDGRMEYAVGSEGNICCGSHGCTVTVYSDGGNKQINLTDHWKDIKPVKNGVISSQGVLIKFKTMKL